MNQALALDVIGILQRRGVRAAVPFARALGINHPAAFIRVVMNKNAPIRVPTVNKG